jgi:uncharacterized membrane protein YkvA (DUF1232 family)
MLYELVDQLCADIERLDEAATLSLFQQLVQSTAMDSVREIAIANRLPVTTEEDAVTIVAATALRFIRETPGMARRLVARLREADESPGCRCSLACLLAYFVQPHDLISDRAPGAYGFLDDAILLRAGTLEYILASEQSAADLEVEADIVAFLIELAPLSSRAQLLQSVTNLSLGMRIAKSMEQSLAESTLAQILEDPLRFRIPAVSRGLSAPPPRQFVQGRWWGVAYVDTAPPTTQ